MRQSNGSSSSELQNYCLQPTLLYKSILYWRSLPHGVPYNARINCSHTHFNIVCANGCHESFDDAPMVLFDLDE